MLETLLSYGEDSNKSHLTSALFYKDVAIKMDATVTAPNERNEGLFQRRALTVGSREFDMMGRLHADLFFQDRFMLNAVGVKIKLIRSKDAFCLMGTTAAKVKIVHASMFVRKVKVISSVFLAHAKTLENGTATYPVRRVACKTIAVPQNYREVSYEKLFSGQLPTRPMVGLVINRAFNGHLESNPFNFKHYNLGEIALYLDGQQQFALKPIQPD